MTETIAKQIIKIKKQDISLVKKIELIANILDKIYISQIRIDSNQSIETELVKNVLEVLNEMVKVLKQGTFIVSKKKMEKIKKKFNIFHFSQLEKN